VNGPVKRLGIILVGVAVAAVVVIASDRGTPVLQPAVLDVPVVDPTSTRELTGGGGSATYGFVPDIEEIPKYAHVAVQATVIDVAPSQFNTPTGELPSAAFDRDLDRYGFLGLHAVTPVTIRIDTVLGTNPQGDLAVKPGDTVIVNVPGGAVTIPFRQDLWEGMGLIGDLAEPLEPGQDPNDLLLPMTMGFRPGVALDEGASVILFLTFQTDYEAVTDDWEVVQGAPRLVVVSSAIGAFSFDATDGATSLSLRGAAQSIDKATVLDLAKSLDTMTQPPIELDLLGRNPPAAKAPGS
jgi:hypothetical protein